MTETQNKNVEYRIDVLETQQKDHERQSDKKYEELSGMKAGLYADLNYIKKDIGEVKDDVRLMRGDMAKLTSFIEKVEGLSREVADLRVLISKVVVQANTSTTEIVLLKDRMKYLERITYGAVGLVLVAFFSALIKITILQ